MKEQITTIEHLIEQGRYLEARSFTSDAIDGNKDTLWKQLYALALSTT